MVIQSYERREKMRFVISKLGRSVVLIRPVYYWLYIFVLFNLPPMYLAVDAMTPDSDACGRNESILRECATRDYEAADKKLNEVYLSLLKKMEGTLSEGPLKQSERSWIKYRDDSCEYFIPVRMELVWLQYGAQTA